MNSATDECSPSPSMRTESGSTSPPATTGSPSRTIDEPAELPMPQPLSEAEELAKARHQLEAEAIRREAIASEMERLREHLSDVESHAAQQNREQDFVTIELHIQAKEAARTVQKMTEEMSDLERSLMKEREKSRDLEIELHRFSVEQHDRSAHHAEIDDVELRLKQIEAKNRTLVKQLEEKSKEANVAREGHVEATRQTNELMEKVAELEQKLDDEQRRKGLLVVECQSLRGELAQVIREAKEMGQPSVPKLSLQSFPIAPHQRSVTPRFTPRNFNTTPRFTPRCSFFQEGYMGETPRNEEAIHNIPESSPKSGSRPRHKRLNSLDSQFSDYSTALLTDRTVREDTGSERPGVESPNTPIVAAAASPSPPPPPPHEQPMFMAQDDEALMMMEWVCVVTAELYSRLKLGGRFGVYIGELS